MAFLLRADWPQFRGMNSAGIAERAVPVEFGPGKNELWSVPLQSGHSSPCVVGDRIFVTTFDRQNKRLSVVCLDRKTGAVNWTRDVAVEKIETGHPSFNPASSSPASDGSHVVAYFGSFGLICFDVDGEKLWDIKMPVAKSYAGNATSPIITGDKVILYRGNHVDHFLLAVDKTTGDEIWNVPQPEPFHSELACTAVPIVVGDKLIVHSARSVQAVDLASGEQVWVAKCATTATSTPVVDDSHVYVAAWNKLGEPALRPELPSFDELVAEHDKDGDGLIDRNEFPRLMIFHRPDGAEAPQNGAPIWFGRTDQDKNQSIDEKEWRKTVQGVERFRAGYQSHGMLALPLGHSGLLGADNIRTLETQSIPGSPVATDS